MTAVLQWIKIAALVWAGSLVFVLLAEIRWLRRWFPDWLRSLSRIVLLVGTVGLLTVTILFGVRMMVGAWESRTQIAEGPKLDLSLASPQDFFLSMYLSMNQSKLNVPVDEEGEEQTFVVELGETASGVATKLQEEGLVTDGELFRRFMSYHGLDVSLEAGVYRLSPAMTMHEIAETLQHGGITGITVTILEGWRLEQVGYWLEYLGLLRADDFIAYATTTKYDYLWLADRPQGASLEGYLFPETYEFPTEVEPADVVDRMLATFDSRAAPEIQSRLAGKEIFDLALSAYRPMTMRDVMILASIVEREAVVAEERPIIASVYFNRLDPAYVEETALRLSSDPTIQYAKGYDAATDNWWPAMLPGEGQVIESPYNTFKVQGMPPGPICSPGLASIQAVLEPADTTYLYFHAVGDGSHVFASTLEEHMRNQQQYAP